MESLIIQNKYKLISKTSEDWICDTYYARKLDDNDKPVSVKLLKRNAISKRTEDLIRFRQEINNISNLNHPGILQILETGEVVDLLYIVTEYIDAGTLLHEIHTGPFSINAGVDIIMRLCSILEYIHGKNIIHRNLNPGSIIINDDKLMLFNFGMTHIREFSDTVKQDDITEIFGYMPPEMSGLVKWSIDERSDLYSTGVILYRILTGKTPFVCNEISSTIHSHISEIPKPPSSHNPRIPEILDKIILKLLEKEPDKRYQSAGGLLLDLQKYAEGNNEFILESDHELVRHHFRTKLVAREKELKKLQHMFNGTLQGKGSICFITGEAGVGKTRLVEELKEYVYSKNKVFIEGTCSPHTSDTPYSPFKEMLNAYAANVNNYSLSRKKEITELLRNNFSKLGEIIIRLNPGMKDMLGDFPPLVPLEHDRESIRFNSTAGRFFKDISKLEDGLVILIDDLHWTDDGSLKILTEIFNDIEDNPVLLIGTYRDDEIPGNNNLLKFINTIKEAGKPYTEIHLDSLNLADMNSLISGLLVEKEEYINNISSFILRKSKGNLFFAIEILKHMVEEKVICYNGRRWEYEEESLDSIKIPGSLVDIILKRVNLLNKNEKEVLEYASVIGSQVDIKLLFSLTDLDNAEVIQIIDRAIILHLIVNLPERGRIGFAHDRIRDAFYGNIENEKRKQLHLSAASVIEYKYAGTIDDVVFKLAYHYIEGENTEKTIEYAYPAGLKAKENFAHDDALKYFKKIIELIKKPSSEIDQLELRCKNEIGDIYITTGEYNRAIEIFNEILPDIHFSNTRVRILGQLSEIYYRKGDWVNCEKYAVKGLNMLSPKLPVKKIPLKKIPVILSIARELSIHFLHSILPGIFVRENQVGDSFDDSFDDSLEESQKLLAGIITSLLRTYVLSDTLKFIQLTLSTLNLIERTLGKSSINLGRALAAFASLIMAIPMFKRSIRYHMQALQIKQQHELPCDIGESLQYIGYCYQWMGKYEISIDYFISCKEKFTEIGDIVEYNMALNGLLLDYLIIGDYKNAKNVLDDYLESVNRTHGEYGIVTSYLYNSWYHLDAVGDLEKAEYYAIKSKDLSAGKHLFHYCVTLIRIGMIMIEKGDNFKAIKYLEEAQNLNDSNFFLKQYVANLYSNLSKAYISDYIQKEHELPPADRRKYIRKIKKISLKSLRKTKNWVTYYGDALRINGEYYALAGKNKKAGTFFLKSIDFCSKIGRKFELALCHYNYGLFLAQTGKNKDSRNNLESAYQIFSDIDAKLYIERLRSLLGIREDTDSSNSIRDLVYRDNLSSIHKMSRDIINIKENDSFLNSVIAKATEVTFAQTGYLFLRNIDNELELAASNIAANTGNLKLSRTHADNASINDTYIISSDTSGINSLLSLPLKLDEEIICVFTLLNPISGTFIENDANLLYEFLNSEVARAINSAREKKLKFEDKTKKIRPITPETEEKIKNAISYVEENFSSQISREGLASKLEIDPDNLGRYFKAITGKKINEYINELRINFSLEELIKTDENIIDIAYSAGFESLSTFNRVFGNIMRTSPKKYRKQNR